MVSEHGGLPISTISWDTLRFFEIHQLIGAQFIPLLSLANQTIGGANHRISRPGPGPQEVPEVSGNGGGHFFELMIWIHGAGIYANIWGTLMGSMLPYIAYMDPMG